MTRLLRLARRTAAAPPPPRWRWCCRCCSSLMFGAVELGNYFLNEHSLVKAVRDGARYAARQDFS